MFGRFNYVINVEPIKVKGITIHEEQMHGMNFNESKVECIICLKMNPKVRSDTSTQICPTAKDKLSSNSVCSGIWSNSDNKKNLSFSSKLDGKRAKVFQLSIRLKREDKEVEIGVTSLTFVGVVFNTELDIPIVTPASKESRANKENSGIFRFDKNCSETEIMKDIRSQLMLNTKKVVPKNVFEDNECRSYSLQECASIRVKCSCIPTNGKTNLEVMNAVLRNELRVRNQALYFFESYSSTQTRDSSTRRHQIHDYSNSMSMPLNPLKLYQIHGSRNDPTRTKSTFSNENYMKYATSNKRGYGSYMLSPNSCKYRDPNQSLSLASSFFSDNSEFTDSSFLSFSDNTSDGRNSTSTEQLSLFDCNQRNCAETFFDGACRTMITKSNSLLSTSINENSEYNSNISYVTDDLDGIINKKVYDKISKFMALNNFVKEKFLCQ